MDILRIGGTAISHFVNNIAPSGVIRSVPLWKQLGRHHNFVRFAGYNGASAVLFGALAYEYVDSRTMFRTANYFHLMHSFAFMFVPITKYPYATGGLIFLGGVLYVVPEYYQAFTSDRRFAFVTELGCFVLIYAWLSMLM